MYDATFNIIIFGDATPGKAMFVQKYFTDLFRSDQTYTTGVEHFVKSLSVEGRKIKLQIKDCGGEERFRFLLTIHARHTRGGLFLYDVANYSTIKHIDDWLSLIREELKPEDVFPILAVGIVPDEEGERQVSREEGIKIAKSRNLNGIVECNPTTGENVEKTFEALTRLMLADIVYRPEEPEKWDESYSKKTFESGGWTTKKTIKRDESYSRRIFKFRNRDKVSPKLPSRQTLLPPPSTSPPGGPPPPPRGPEDPRPANPVSLRGAIMGELKRLFSNRTNNS